MDTIILIPARMAASRLPGKPMVDIAGKPMIEHVWQRGMEAGLGPVVIATDSKEIKSHMQSIGANVVMTRDDHQSGSDRIFEALETFDQKERYNQILNLQGDLPLLDPALLKRCVMPLKDADVALSTLVSVIEDEDELNNPNVVKLIGTPVNSGSDENRLRALYFTRAAAPTGAGPHYHHIGLYGFKRAALKKFVSLPPSRLEQSERLEQLRALEAGMRIDAMIVNTVPFGVDTKDDLEKVRDLILNNA